MKKKLLCVLCILVILNGLLSFFLGNSISVSEMMPFLDTLLIVSAIIFGIVGAWLAVIWQNTTLSNSEQNENILYLKRTVLCLFVVISFSIIIKFLYPYVKYTALLLSDNTIIWIRRFFAFSSGISALILMLALFLTLLSFDFFSFDDDIKKQKKEQESDYKKRQMSQTNKIKN